MPRIVATLFLDFPIHGGICLQSVCRCLTREISSPVLPMDLFVCFAFLLLLLGDGIPVSAKKTSEKNEMSLKKGRRGKMEKPDKDKGCDK